MIQEDSTRMSWDDYFLSITKAVAGRSTCVKRHVGAVIVSSDHHLLATGYNGPPRGAPHRTEETCSRRDVQSGTRPDIVCCAHAEMNALTQAARHGTAIVGATLYTLLRPCAWCARSIVNAGIKEVVYVNAYADEEAMRVFQESTVVVRCRVPAWMADDAPDLVQIGAQEATIKAETRGAVAALRATLFRLGGDVDITSAAPSQIQDEIWEHVRRLEFNAKVRSKS